ncbi:MAG TPA: DUF4249 domain-containing protein [Bacteroidia bacterium]|nr:DUF4249 domain-containing protein [Bacteroidia bacterium]
MRKLLFILPVLFTLSGCVPKPIDIDVPPAPEKLVVAAQVIPNHIMVIGLTHSFSALDSGGNQDTLSNSFINRILVSHAIVTLDHPGGTDTLYQLTPGIYASVNVLLSSYGSYTLHAKDPETGEEIKATTQLLPQIRFDTIIPSIVLAGNDSTVNIHYELTDFPAEENYYVVSYYRKSQDTSAFDIYSYFQQGSNELNTFDLVSDADFDQDGKLSRDKQLPGIGINDTIAVTVANITKGYYEFLTAYKRSGSLFNQLSGEPIDFPTNVEGGYGYFATQFPDVHFYYMSNYH